MGFRALHAKRAQDLVCLEQSRGGWKKGHRRVCLSFYAHFLRGAGTSRPDIVAAIRAMAGNCVPSYPSESNDSTIAKIVSDVFSNPLKKHTTANLVKWLGIQNHEARALELQTLIPSEVAAERKLPKGGKRAAEKAIRLELIKDQIANHGMVSTRALVHVLKAKGISTGKSTLERDLEELGFKTIGRQKAGRPKENGAKQLALLESEKVGN